jgi:hypothetical protein
MREEKISSGKTDLLSKIGVSYSKSGIWITNRLMSKKKRTILMFYNAGMCTFVTMYCLSP